MASGFLDSLSEQQKSALEELKEKTKEVQAVREHPDGDAYLLRFLRATMKKKKSARLFQVETKGKHEGAYDRLMKAIEFNEKYEADKEPDCFAEFAKVKPNSSWLDTKVKHIVVNEKVGLFWTNCDPDAFTKEQWLRCFAYALESAETALREFRLEHGLDDRPKLIAIQDTAGLGFGARKMSKLFRIYNDIAGLYHPELVSKIYIVNAPWILKQVMNFVSTVVDPGTLEKVKIVSDAKKTLPGVFDTEFLPAEYGGDGENAAIPIHAQGK